MSSGFGTIVHPTDFSESGTAAFVHALRIALSAKCKLYLVHVAETNEPEEQDGFPHVRATLAHWHLLDAKVASAEVANRLGLHVAKIGFAKHDPVRSLLYFLDRHATDLLVLATHGRDGIARWLQGSIAEKLSHTARVPTLFFPPNANGFVDQGTGEIHLSRVLIPVDHSPLASSALATVEDFVKLLGAEKAKIDLMHVGNNTPSITRPVTGDPVGIKTLTGDVVGTILQEASEQKADLIAMPTAGHNGLLDALRGSTTERVLRHAACPVLAVPVA
jgi:nucleotide-binding universal stress UspA family protein